MTPGKVASDALAVSEATLNLSSGIPVIKATVVHVDTKTGRSLATSTVSLGWKAETIAAAKAFAEAVERDVAGTICDHAERNFSFNPDSEPEGGLAELLEEDPATPG